MAEKWQSWEAFRGSGPVANLRIGFCTFATMVGGELGKAHESFFGGDTRQNESGVVLLHALQSSRMPKNDVLRSPQRGKINEPIIPNKPK